MTDKILVDKRDGVGWVTINNPARRNAISLEMWQSMGAAFADFAADGAIRCAVIHWVNSYRTAMQSADVYGFWSKTASEREYYRKPSRQETVT